MNRCKQRVDLTFGTKKTGPRICRMGTAPDDSVTKDVGLGCWDSKRG